MFSFSLTWLYKSNFFFKKLLHDMYISNLINKKINDFIHFYITFIKMIVLISSVSSKINIFLKIFQR